MITASLTQHSFDTGELSSILAQAPTPEFISSPGYLVSTRQHSQTSSFMHAPPTGGIEFLYNQPVLKKDPVHSASVLGNTETGGGRLRALPSRSLKRYFLGLSQ